jgi:hypothetical protein
MQCGRTAALQGFEVNHRVLVVSLITGPLFLGLIFNALFGLLDGWLRQHS